MNSYQPFAKHGSEKMIYDIRMGPQCLYHDGIFYAVYQANPNDGKALPHIIKRDKNGVWSDPALLGDIVRYDHHYAPILWLDEQRHFHVVYHCHSGFDETRHLVSTAPLDITAWQDGPEVAPSISYPRLLRQPNGRLLLFYRALGHMGYWTYQTSDDGGYNWTIPNTSLVDFDYLPQLPGDEWSGSYHSVALGPDGNSLHLAFVYWDERGYVYRNWRHPLYETHVGNRNRYHLYYLRLDLTSGKLYTVDGQHLPRPVNRRAAQACLVWDTGHHLSNMPAILIDEQDQPSFLMPVSEQTEYDCTFWFVRREADQWAQYPVTKANHTWNGAHLEYGDNGLITAFLIAKPPHVGDLPYGGGTLQEWHSADGGETWILQGEIRPQDGFVCNNPKPVEDAFGQPLKRTLTFYGWPGPDGIYPDQTFRGQAYLWPDGHFL